MDYTDIADGSQDPDNDQLTNIAEFENGTAPDQADTDGDGQIDGLEVLYQSDPLNPNETAVIEVSAAGPPAMYLIFIAMLVIGFKANLSARSCSFEDPKTIYQ
jgi:hypothetical protein